MSPRRYHILILVGLLAGLAACTSRYRLDLVMAFESEPRKVKIETTSYLPQARLGNPFSDRKVLPGASAVLIVRSSTRGETFPNSPLSKALQFDEYLQSDLYLEITDPPAAGRTPLRDRSLVQILGRFEQPAEEKIFLPDDTGAMMIDSVTANHVFVTVGGTFSNHLGQAVTVSGSVRVDRPRR